jgi:5-formyltetrahydrofolate cyclo-ligase
MPSSHPRDHRAKQRQRLRSWRNGLTVEYRRDAGLVAAELLSEHRWYRAARRIALYYPVGSEFDTGPLSLMAQRDGKQVFLPVLGFRGSKMRFARTHADSHFRINRHRIPEPAHAARRLNPRFLDLVIVPLLAFDRKGHRLGSGAGYYDRCFDFKNRANGRPRLVAMAFDGQEIDRIAAERWDVPLDAIVTESRLLIIRD